MFHAPLLEQVASGVERREFAKGIAKFGLIAKADDQYQRFSSSMNISHERGRDADKVAQEHGGTGHDNAVFSFDSRHFVFGVAGRKGGDGGCDAMANMAGRGGPEIAQRNGACDCGAAILMAGHIEGDRVDAQIGAQLRPNGYALIGQLRGGYAIGAVGVIDSKTGGGCGNSASNGGDIVKRPGGHEASSWAVVVGERVSFAGAFTALIFLTLVGTELLLLGDSEPTAEFFQRNDRWMKFMMLGPLLMALGLLVWFGAAYWTQAS